MRKASIINLLHFLLFIPSMLLVGHLILSPPVIPDGFRKITRDINCIIDRDENTI